MSRHPAPRVLAGLVKLGLVLNPILRLTSFFAASKFPPIIQDIMSKVPTSEAAGEAAGEAIQSASRGNAVCLPPPPPPQPVWAARKLIRQTILGSVTREPCPP